MTDEWDEHESGGAVFDCAICVRETERAILVDLDGEERWFPKSAIHDESEVTAPGDEGELVIERWLAEKEELLD